MSLDLLGRLAWVCIVPGSVFVLSIADDDVVITRFALPVTGCVGVAFTEVLILDGLRREIVITFHDDCVTALSKDCIVPCRFHKKLRHLIATHDICGIDLCARRPDNSASAVELSSAR